MPKRSIRTPTSVAHELSSKVEINTIADFQTFIQARDVQRVQLQYANIYRSKVLSDHGSQFTVFTGDGIHLYDKPAVVVKCAKLRLADKPLPLHNEQRKLAASLLREVTVLTHPRLRLHPNIVRLFWYDLVEESDGIYTPALVMERAMLGSLSDLLDCRRSRLSYECKRGLCLNISSGLLALHQAFVVHGDVKSDNVLVFPSSMSPGLYTAKITDFGSIISTASPLNGEYPRYHGTPLTNAPEVGEQSGLGKLDAIGLIRCDNYSFGLLILQTATGSLNQKVTMKDAEVLKSAFHLLSQAGHPYESEKVLTQVLEHLLAYEPSRRCCDLSIIKNLLRPVQSNDLSVADLQLLPSNDMHREERDTPESMKSLFGDSHYLDFNLDIQIEAERDTQKIIFQSISADAKSSKATTSGRAYFQLALAYSIGYGTKVNFDNMLDAALKSAQKGYLPAQAVVTAWFEAFQKPMSVDKDTQIDWLFEATAWGSYAASTCLRRLEPDQYYEARVQFHRSGGYNQYFYHKEPPDYIQSTDFPSSLVPDYYRDNIEELNTLAESAAIYGDVSLMKHLVRKLNVNPALTNRWGESLLLLCCKGGHLNVLKVLAEAGASASQYNSQGNVVCESPIHWLIAFDDEQTRAAATVLAQVCDKSDPDISWNHPSIDLPGRFPLGSPLHFAVYSDNIECTKALLEELSVSINLTGSSESTALEYAVPRRKVHAAELLISKGGLNDPSLNSYVICELGTTLRHEILAAAGVTQKAPATLAVNCLDAVLEKRPELLDAGADEGGTPLIGAVEYHDRDTVKALIDCGCNVNIATAEEFEGKTALHFITHNKLQYEDDDILDLLWKAGADFSAHTLVGGKSVLHFAARDDCISVAAQLLDQGMSINATTIRYGETPLHIAAYYGSYAVAQLLLERGADTQIGHLDATYHQWDWDDLTPLAVAALKSRKRMVELLLEFGASPVVRPSSGHTVIHLAVTELDCKMLKMLLEVPQLATSEVVNARAVDGMTALHLCAGSLGRHEHLGLLLRAGADVGALTETGHSVLDIAYQTRDGLRRWLGEEDAEKGDAEKTDTEIPNRDEEVFGFSLFQSILVPNVATSIEGATVSMIGDPKWDSEQGNKGNVEHDMNEEITVTSKETQEDAILIPKTATRIDGVTLSMPEDPELEIEQDTQGNIEQDMDDEASVSSEEIQEEIQAEEFHFNAPEELQRWHNSIKMLEKHGAKRCCAYPFPRELLSLNLSNIKGSSVKLKVDLQI